MRDIITRQKMQHEFAGVKNAGHGNAKGWAENVGVFDLLWRYLKSVPVSLNDSDGPWRLSARDNKSRTNNAGRSDEVLRWHTRNSSHFSDIYDDRRWSRDRQN